MPSILCMKVSNESFTLFINFFDLIITGALIIIVYSLKDKEIYRPQESEDVENYQMLTKFFLGINAIIIPTIIIGIMTIRYSRFQRFYRKLRFILEGPCFLISIFYSFTNIFYLNEKLQLLHSENKILDFALNLTFREMKEKLKFNIALMLILGCFITFRFFMIIWLKCTKYDRTVGYQ